MKKIVAILIMICAVQMPLMTFAQKNADAAKAEKARLANVKKEIASAKANLKDNKDLDKTEASITKLLSDTLNIRDKRIHELLIESLRKQYEQGNEKLYLKQQMDTASLVMVAYRTYLAAERLDSVESLPDAKGRVEYSYRKSNAQLLAQLYGNLYRGGIFMLNHQKYKEAVECMDTYLTAPSWPMLDGMLKIDSLRMRHASYVSLVAGSRAKDEKAALKYEDDALQYRPRLETTLQYLADIYGQRKDSVRYEKLLNEGVDLYPKSPYFFSQLVDFYSDQAKYDKALAIVDKVLDAEPMNGLAHETKQTLLLNLARYDECIKEGEALLAENDSLPDVNYNMALAYYNQALEIEKNTDMKRSERTRKMNALYKKCLPYMEKYRVLKPEEKDKWRPVLYNVYLNLNMGEEFKSLSSRSRE